MFKVAVLSVLVCAVASAPSPGFLHGGYHGGYALPAATSYSSRVDVHTPVVKTVVAAPVHYSTPLVSSYGYGGLGHGYGGYGGYGLGHGLSLGHGYSLGGHGYGLGGGSYSLGGGSYGLGHGIGLGHGVGLGHGYGYGYGH